MRHPILTRTAATLAIMAALSACATLTACGGGDGTDDDPCITEARAPGADVCTLGDLDCGSPVMLQRAAEQCLTVYRGTGSACYVSGYRLSRAVALHAVRNAPECHATVHTSVIEVR